MTTKGAKHTIGRVGATLGHKLNLIKQFVAPRSPRAARDPADLSKPPMIRLSSAQEEHAGGDLAAPHFAAFNKERDTRLRQLRRIRKQLSDGPIVLCSFNTGYGSLFANWAASCDVHGIDSRQFTLVFPTDEKAELLARKLGFSTYFHPQTFGDLPEQANKIFGDGDFRRIIFAKIAMVQDMLEIGGNYIRQDVDLVWFKDPRDELTRRAVDGGLDLLFMDDGPNQLHKPLHYNSGFVYLRDNAHTKFAWNLIFSNYGYVFVDGGEQRMINQIMSHLMERGLRSANLPEHLFANGHLFTSNNEIPPDSFVAHCSWTGNIDAKIEMMKRIGVWYL